MTSWVTWVQLKNWGLVIWDWNFGGRMENCTTWERDIQREFLCDFVWHNFIWFLFHIMTMAGCEDSLLFEFLSHMLQFFIFPPKYQPQIIILCGTYFIFRMLWLICDNAQGEIGFVYSSFYFEMSNASTARMRYFYKLNETVTDVYKIVHVIVWHTNMSLNIVIWINFRTCISLIPP